MRALLALAGLAGGVLLFVATASTVIQIKVLTVVKDTLSGSDRHGIALVLIGAFALLMLAGALRGARPAMLAVAICGIAALAISIIGDAGDIHDTGQIGQLYEDATAAAGAGFYLETLGGALLLMAGGGLLLFSGAGRGREAAPDAGASDAPAPEGEPQEPDDWFSRASE